MFIVVHTETEESWDTFDWNCEWRLKGLIRFENPILDWPHRNCIRVFYYYDFFSHWQMLKWTLRKMTSHWRG